MNLEEKVHLLDQPNQAAYDLELDRLLEKYWDQVCATPFEQGEE